MRNIRTARHGFTLIEILIVVVILGILASIVIPQFTNASDQAAVSQARTQLQSMRSQCQLFRAQKSYLPGDVGGKEGDGKMDTAELCFDELVEEGYIPQSPVIGDKFKWELNADTNPGTRLIITTTDEDVDTSGW